MKEYFQKNNVPFVESDGRLLLQCPSCKKENLGMPLATLYFNQESEQAQCNECGLVCNQYALTRFFKAKGTSVLVEPSSHTQNHSKIPRLWTIEEILDYNFGEEEWLIESILSKQCLMALSGHPAGYKTWLTVYFALCVSKGLPILSRFNTRKGKVLVVDEEDHIREVQKRLKLLGGKDATDIYYFSQCGLRVDDEKSLNLILEKVKELGIALVIFDSLVRIHGKDENEARSMSLVFGYIQKIQNAGASVIFTHHHKKPSEEGADSSRSSMRGSSDILAAVDCHISVDKKDKETLVLNQKKLRQGKQLDPFEVKILTDDKGQPIGFSYVGEYDVKLKKAEQVTDILVELIKDESMSRVEIIGALKDEGYGKASVEDGIKLAEEKGIIERIPKDELPVEDRKKAIYRLPTSRTNLSPFQPLYEIGKQEEGVTDAQTV